jgi:hypothetical protein
MERAARAQSEGTGAPTCTGSIAQAAGLARPRSRAAVTSSATFASELIASPIDRISTGRKADMINRVRSLIDRPIPGRQLHQTIEANFDAIVEMHSPSWVGTRDRRCRRAAISRLAS